MDPVRLLVDSVLVMSPGGELLQVELAAALARTRPTGAALTVLRRRDQQRLGDIPGVTTITENGRFAALSRKWRWLMWDLPRHARRLRADAVFEASGPVSARLQRRCGVVTTTNNMLAFADELMAPAHPLSAVAMQRRLRRAQLVNGLRRADAVILHSEHALRTVTVHTGDISGKTTVVHTGVPPDARLDPDHPPRHPNEGRPYLLYLSVFRRAKNHLRLVDAYRRLRERSTEAPELLFAGMREDDDYLAEISAHIEASGLADDVRTIGALDREDIPAWLHHATVNVFPSLAETNSVVITEILGMHGVLAAADIAPIREVAGAAAAYFDPLDADAMAATLGALCDHSERPRQLRAAAAKRAGALSWDACGEAIWTSAAQVHAERSGPPDLRRR